MCGCRGTKKSVSNVNANARANANRRIAPSINTRSSLNQPNTQIIRATGMSKEQRDEERKKRIQLILKSKNQ